MPHLLIKNNEFRLNNNTKTMGNKVTVLRVSPTKPNGTGAIRKTKSDVLQKVNLT